MAERLKILLKSEYHRCLLLSSSKFDGGASYEGGGCASKSFGVRVSNEIRVESLSAIGSTKNQLYSGRLIRTSQPERVIF